MNQRLISLTFQISDAVVEEFSKNPKKSPIKDKTYFDAVGTVINNAKDWEGQRVFRTKKRNVLESDEPKSADPEKPESADPEKLKSADPEKPKSADPEK